MKCPQCDHIDNRVLDTRVTKDGDIKRRRECLKCKSRFTTVETVLAHLPFVVKKDGRREPFNKDKLRRGVQLSCLKRPVSLAHIEEIIGRISRFAQSSNEKEITSLSLGQAVMHELRELDHVAYVRFASVYKNFEDVNEFLETLRTDNLEHPDH